MPKYLREYLASRSLESAAFNLPANEFYSCLGAAVRLAGSDELNKLECVFPEFVSEMRQRYHAPGGALNQAEADYICEMVESAVRIENDD